MLAKHLDQRQIEFTRDGSIVGHRHPRLDRNLATAEVSKREHLNHGCRLGTGRGGFAPHQIANGSKRMRKIRFIGDPHPDLGLTDSAVVVKDFTNHFAIGNDDPRAVGMRERRVEQRDGLHLALDAGYGDVFADAVRFREYDGESRDHIAQHTP